MKGNTVAKMIMTSPTGVETVVYVQNETGKVFEYSTNSYYGRVSSLEKVGYTFKTSSIEEKESTKETTKSDGGATSYYDMPFNEWVTTNDMMEYLAEHKWGKYGIHLKDIFKGICRWGDKDGTDESYDTRKIIYYGVRILRLLVGTEETRKYLHSLLDDPQFQEREENVGSTDTNM